MAAQLSPISSSDFINIGFQLLSIWGLATQIKENDN